MVIAFHLEFTIRFKLRVEGHWNFRFNLQILVSCATCDNISRAREL